MEGFSAVPEEKPTEASSREEGRTIDARVDLRLAPRLEDNDASFSNAFEQLGVIRTIEDGILVVMKESSKDRINIRHIPGETIFFTSSRDDVPLESISKSSSKNVDRDKLFLCNGDEFEGRFLRLDLRFVYFRAFEVELKIPRYRVYALHWKSSGSD